MALIVVHVSAYAKTGIAIKQLTSNQKNFLKNILCIKYEAYYESENESLVLYFDSNASTSGTEVMSFPSGGVILSIGEKPNTLPKSPRGNFLVFVLYPTTASL